MEQLDAMPPRRNCGIPWDRVLDGTPWKLVRGVDYDADEQAVAQRAWSAAKRRGVRVVVRYSREMRHVCVQAVEEG